MRRCVLLRGPIDDDTATACIAQLLYVAHDAPKEPATLCVDSPGGSATASMAIIRTMESLSCRLGTHCCGAAGGTAAAIVAHGRRGFRTAIPGAIFVFAPFVAEAGGSDIEAGFSRVGMAFTEVIAEDTDKHEAEVASLFASHAELASAEALQFGLIDAISTNPTKPPETRSPKGCLWTVVEAVIGIARAGVQSADHRRSRF